jgi:hypothetical protein
MTLLSYKLGKFLLEKNVQLVIKIPPLVYMIPDYQMVYFHVHKNPQLNPILSQKNSVNSVKFYSLGFTLI